MEGKCTNVLLFSSSVRILGTSQFRGDNSDLREVTEASGSNAVGSGSSSNSQGLDIKSVGSYS